MSSDQKTCFKCGVERPLTEFCKHSQLPCPLCGSDNIVGNTWAVGDEDAEKFGAEVYGEIWAFECSDCLCAAPVQSWNKRWIEPPSMPKEGQRILQTYRHDDGSESSPVISVWREAMIGHWRPLVRWMPIPKTN